MQRMQPLDLRNMDMEQIKIETARIDLQLKQLELENRPTFWKSVLTNPAFLAAVITVCITGGTTFITSNAAKQQRDSESARAAQQRALDEAKSRAERNTVILLGFINLGGPDIIAPKLKLFLDAGLLQDDSSGTLRKAQQEMERQAAAAKH